MGIRERGRIEVLKECLRQIGTDADRSSGILKYVERYYLDTVEQLRERGGEGTADLGISLNVNTDLGERER